MELLSCITLIFFLNTTHPGSKKNIAVRYAFFVTTLTLHIRYIYVQAKRINKISDVSFINIIIKLTDCAKNKILTSLASANRSSSSFSSSSTKGGGSTPSAIFSEVAYSNELSPLLCLSAVRVSFWSVSSRSVPRSLWKRFALLTFSPN